MIHWLNPAALAGLALLALPILIHLLRTRQAERIPFPSLRFVLPSETAAVRLRLPADWLLLVVRLAIVAATVTAVAGPVVVPPSRVRAWNGRTARAVIVDTPAGIPAADAPRKGLLDAAREVAAIEERAALTAVRIESVSVSDALVRATNWLSQAPPARREIVVISGFPEGTVWDGALDAVPVDVGLRFVRVGEQIASRRLTSSTLLSAPGMPAASIETELNGPQTRVRLTRSLTDQSGLRIIGGDPQSRAVQALWRAVAAAGAPAPSAREPMMCLFGSSEAGFSASPIDSATPRWIVRTLMRLQSDDDLRGISRSVVGSGLPASDQWAVVAADRNGGPLVRVSTSNGQLLMQVGAPADSFVAAASVRALLGARAGEPSHPDQEILRIPPEILAARSRSAAVVEADAWRRAEGSDGRWLWVAAAVLLGIEQALRRPALRASEEVRDAA
jgi:aerotolerance regulator-like protein